MKLKRRRAQNLEPNGSIQQNELIGANLNLTQNTRPYTREIRELRKLTSDDVKMSVDDYAALFADQREFTRSGKPARLAHRIEQLRRLREMIVAESEAICEAVYKDLRRKSEWTHLIEIGSVLNEIDHMISNVKEWMAPVAVSRTLVSVLDTPQIYKEPKGVVLIIGPWNYPIWTVLGPLVNIIAAGNTAIIKPSEVSSHVAEVYERIFSKTFPKNFLAVVQGGVHETTELLKQPFDHIVYTGNTHVGHIVMEAAAKNLTTITLELGGKSPAIVLADADIDVTARRLVWGKLINCGQTCIAPDYVLVVASVKARLIAALIATTRQFYGDDAQRSDDYSRIINERHLRRLSSMLDKSNASVLFQGGRIDVEDLFMPPVYLDATPDDESMKEEIFGPIFPIITVQNLDDAIEHVNAGACPLAAYLFTREEQAVDAFVARTRSGGVCVNDVMIHAAKKKYNGFVRLSAKKCRSQLGAKSQHCWQRTKPSHNTASSAAPGFHFGGFGKSGMGKYHGKAGFDEFTHEKPVLKRGFFGDGLAAGRYPPLTNEKLKQLSRMTSTRPIVPQCVWRAISALPYFLIGVTLGYISGRYWPNGRQITGGSPTYYRY